MGYFRLLLSLLIVQAHTSAPGDHYALANLAVLLFYAISGYGCTAAMQGRYRGRPLLFLVNRYLRLWPTYAIVFGLSCWLMLWVPVPLASIPRGWAWMANLLMLRADAVPAAWVIPYMLLGYVAIGLGASATARRAGLWLLVSFAWAQYHAFLLDWGDYYHSIAAWSLAYSVGAVIYWLGLVVPKDQGLGAVAGGIAFPVFLVHFPIQAALPLVPGWSLFFATLFPTLALSWVLWRFVELPVDRFRKSLRS
jgi:peptidoglycan/LPS O-acetylase OafA/YrhL